MLNSSDEVFTDKHSRKIQEIVHSGYGIYKLKVYLFVCVEVLRPSQPNGIMSSAVSLPNHTFTGQA